jgi:hypothetical protein
MTDREATAVVGEPLRVALDRQERTRRSMHRFEKPRMGLDRSNMIGRQRSPRPGQILRGKSPTMCDLHGVAPWSMRRIAKPLRCLFPASKSALNASDHEPIEADRTVSRCEPDSGPSPRRNTHRPQSNPTAAGRMVRGGQVAAPKMAAARVAQSRGLNAERAVILAGRAPASTVPRARPQDRGRPRPPP